MLWLALEVLLWLWAEVLLWLWLEALLLLCWLEALWRLWPEALLLWLLAESLLCIGVHCYGLRLPDGVDILLLLLWWFLVAVWWQGVIVVIILVERPIRIEIVILIVGCGGIVIISGAELCLVAGAGLLERKVCRRLCAGVVVELEPGVGRVELVPARLVGLCRLPGRLEVVELTPRLLLSKLLSLWRGGECSPCSASC